MIDLKKHALLPSLAAALLCMGGAVWARLEVDFSELYDAETRQTAEQYRTAALFDLHSTATFKLRMSRDTMLKMGLSKDSFSREHNRLTDPLRRAAFAEATLRNVSKRLQPEGQELLYNMLLGQLHNSVVSLKPTDDELSETIHFLEAYKAFWKLVGKETVPEVENIEDESLSSSASEVLHQLLKSPLKTAEINRNPRQFFPMAANKNNLKNFLTSVFNIPRNMVEDADNMAAVRAYVRREFESMGLLVTDHVFATYETDYLYGERLEGTNVVALLPGRRWGRGGDRPVVVCAHLDTVARSPGADDNGSGMAAVMEAARMMTSAGCVYDNTIVFVAFDLEELGTQGSMMFVKDFVSRVLQQQLRTARPAAAIVLDCIANWDPAQHSQIIPDTWYEYLPRFVARLHMVNNTGDFLSVIYRDGVDSFLANRFSSYYSRLSNPEYRLELLAVLGLGPNKPSPATLHRHFDVLRSDHARFWYHGEDGETGINTTIPAVLVTDTGPFRGRLRQCYHQECDTYAADASPDVGMLTKATEAVAWTAADVAGARCGPRGRLDIRQLFRIVSGFMPDDKKTDGDRSTEMINEELNTETNLPNRQIQTTEVFNHNTNATSTKFSEKLTSKKNDPSVASVTNALEMLHFLGVVPSIEQLALQQQQQSPKRSRRPLTRARSIGNRRQSPPTTSSYFLTEEDRRGATLSKVN